MPKDSLCPINSIYFSSASPDINYYNEIYVGKSTSLYISRTTENLPISEFRFTEGEGVCYLNHDGKKKKLYIILLKIY